MIATVKVDRFSIFPAEDTLGISMRFVDNNDVVYYYDFLPDFKADTYALMGWLIHRIMKLVDASTSKEVEGKYVRVAYDEEHDKHVVKDIGHVMYEKWMIGSHDSV